MKKDNSFKTPILFLIFNRPETEKKVFEQIKKIKPKYLYVAADGPRKNKNGEKQKCLEARRIVDEGVNWPCEVKKMYREENLGCGKGLSKAIAWFFDNVESGIILEDDCVPDITFFRYCGELLIKYKDDERVMVISGDNYQYGFNRTKNSYYFSRYPHCWGWASWRRAWSKFDFDMEQWPDIKKTKFIKDILNNNFLLVGYWNMIFDKTYKHEIDTWDYQWTFACWINSGLAILPNVNLVSNVGIGVDATHTFTGSSATDQMSKSLEYPLKHPSYVIRDNVSDSRTENSNFLTLRVILGLLFNFLRKQ